MVTRSRYHEEACPSLCAFCPLHPQNEATAITPVALAARSSEQCLPCSDAALLTVLWFSPLSSNRKAA